MELSFLGTRGRSSVAVVTRAWRGYGELTIFGTAHMTAIFHRELSWRYIKMYTGFGHKADKAGPDPGLVDFLTAPTYHFFLALPVVFSHPGGPPFSKLCIYRAGPKYHSQFASIFQESLGRSGKQQQEKNFPNLGTVI